jgi:hypothetical protein
MHEWFITGLEVLALIAMATMIAIVIIAFIDVFKG